MDSLNPMFSKNHPQKKKTTNRQQTNTVPVQRKDRSDKKEDVKIPFSTEERQIIKILAKRYRMSTTAYSSQLLGAILTRQADYPPVEYSANGKRSVHAKLSAREYDLLFDYCVKWDCSRREAAYRILTAAIKIESRGMAIEKL